MSVILSWSRSEETLQRRGRGSPLSIIPFSLPSRELSLVRLGPGILYDPRLLK